MIGISPTTTKYRACGIAVGLTVGFFVFNALFSGKITRFDEAAFDEGESHFAVFDGIKIHCRNAADAQECLSPEALSKFPDRVLWLGNSQLHAINQRKPEDQTAPELLHQMLRRQKRYLLTLSEPNANLQEHLVLFAYLYPLLRPRTLLLPVVFDDLRETGLRSEIATALRDSDTQATLAKFDVGKSLLHANVHPGTSEDDLAGIADTVQERAERALTEWLSEHWDLWKSRPEARGQLHLALYKARNTILGIKPTTARKVIPGRYAANWDALRAIVTLAERHNIRTVLYVVPLRTDISIPYDSQQYQAFKGQLVADFGLKPHVTFADLEGVVANEHWGTKAGTSVGEEPEYDFMHFRGKGHEALAAALFQLITANKPRNGL